MSLNLSNFIDGFALQAYLKAEEGVSHAAGYSYDYWYIDGSIHSDFVDQWDDKRIKNIIVDCEFYKIKPIFHGNFKAPLSSDVEAIRLSAIEYIKKEIDVCAKLQCPLIIHGSVIVEPRKIQMAKKIALFGLISSLKTLKKYADERGVKLWLENLSNYPNYRPFYYIGTKIDEFSSILNEVDISIFLDFGHANINAENPVEEFFNQFHSHIAGISMSNNDGKIDQHLKLEDGNMDYKNIVRSILNSKWHGVVGFETRNASPDQSIKSLLALINNVNSEQNLKNEKMI